MSRLFPIAGLTLANQQTFGITASDQASHVVLERLTQLLHLTRSPHAPDQLIVLATAPSARRGTWHPPVPVECAELTCPVPTNETLDELADLAFVRLLMLIGCQVELHGGMLVHGALAEWQGRGVIFAAPGGTGKTTTTRRLPPPWRVLCDDTTLIVRDAQGKFWAHPTYQITRLGQNGYPTNWEIQVCASVCALFFLAQAENDSLQLVGQSQATGLLVNSVEQASVALIRQLADTARHAARRRRFDNICAFAQSVPAYILRLSLQGEFWKQVENVL
jgi:SynChlorMet cassette protein ScmC